MLPEILIACVFAILLASSAPLPIMLFTGLSSTLLYGLGSRSIPRGERIRWGILLLCFLAMSIQVIIRQGLAHQASMPLRSFEKLEKTYLVRVTQSKPSGFSAKILSAEGHTVFPSIPVSVFSPGYSVLPGDTLRLTGILSGAFENKLRLSPRILKRVKSSCVSWIFDLRTRCLRVFRTHLPRIHADVMAALILGTQGVTLKPTMVNLFRDLGLLHLLVVSGAQTALITQMILTVLRRLFLPQGVIWITVLVFNSLFMVMTGAEVSIVRAVLMVQISTFLTLQNRQREMLDVLWLTAILLLIFNPAYLYKLGFILSFLATFALIDLKSRLEKLLSAVSWLPGSMRSPLALSLAPLLLTMPVIAYVYHRWDILSLLANMLMAPLIEVLVLVGFIALLLGLFIPVLAHILFIFLQGLLVVVLLTCNGLYAVPFHTLRLEHVFLVNILFYYLFFWLVVYQWKNHKKFLPYLVLTALVVAGINLMLFIG